VGEIASVVPSRVTVVSVAEPIYPNPPYTGYADPGEERAHRRLLEQAAEDLLVPRASGESGDDVLTRRARALRGVRARTTRTSPRRLRVLDVLGAITVGGSGVAGTRERFLVKLGPTRRHDESELDDNV
jgi:hypothetical protein